MQKRCFVIAPIGTPRSPTRIRTLEVFEGIIRPRVTQLGYSVLGAHEFAEPGTITDRIVQHLSEDDLVIADLSEGNPNVFYELAIRQVLNKPIVHIIQRGYKIPFDVAGLTVIVFTLGRPKAAGDAIAEQVRTMEADPSKTGAATSALQAREAVLAAQKFKVTRDLPHQLHHVSLPVTNFKKSCHFYREVVGLQEVKRPSHFDFNGSWFLLPSGQQLHLLQNRKGTFRSNPGETDYRDAHFALRVRDFEAAKERLDANGVKLRRIWSMDGNRYVGGYFCDPDGHVIEINAKTRPEEEDLELAETPCVGAPKKKSRLK